MFANGWLSSLSSEEQDQVIQEVEAILKPQLYQDGGWIADYRRLRVVAYKGKGKIS